MMAYINGPRWVHACHVAHDRNLKCVLSFVHSTLSNMERPDFQMRILYQWCYQVVIGLAYAQWDSGGLTRVGWGGGEVVAISRLIVIFSDIETPEYYVH